MLKISSCKKKSKVFSFQKGEWWDHGGFMTSRLVQTVSSGQQHIHFGDMSKSAYIENYILIYPVFRFMIW